jgi:hypothetical protein
MQTYGFDYVFAVSWVKINEALARNLAGTSIELNYAGQDSDTGSNITLRCRLAPWLITDGGGNTLVRLQLPIAGGSLELAGGALQGSYDLTGVSLVVEVSLSWIGAGQASLSGNVGLTKLAFSPSSGTDRNAPGYVSIVNILDPQKRLDTLAAGILSAHAVEILLNNKAQLEYIFAEVIPAPVGVGSWLQPRKWLYYNVAVKGGPNALCFLCLLDDREFPPGAPRFDASNLSAANDLVVLISQPVFFANVLLPAVRASFGGASFSQSCTNDVCTITNSGDFSVGNVQASHYSLAVDSAGNGLAISASGGGPLKFFFGVADLPNASYSWSVSSNNRQSFGNKVLTFTPDPQPNIQHSQDMPWYDWVLIVFTGITNAVGLASAIYDAVKGFGDNSQEMGVGTINSTLQSAIGGSLLNLGDLVDWHLAGQGLSLSSAGIEGALYVRGNFG